MDPCPHPSSQAMSQGGATAVAGVEQLEQLEAAFTRLVDSTADNEVKDTLLFNKDKLVNNEVVSTKALQGLTAEQLMACGLSRAAVAALKLVFPTPTTAGAGPVGGGGSTRPVDTTKRFLQSLQGYPSDSSLDVQQGWPSAPTTAELVQSMEGSLMCKDGRQAQLPVSDGLYGRLVAAEPDLEQVLQPLSQCGAEALSVLVSSALQANMSAPTDEIVLAGYVDKLIWDILELSARTLRSQTLTRKRNSTEHSLTSCKLKPDFLLLAKQTLLMKGEDKANAVDMPVAKEELRGKLKQWSARHHGLIEYLLCYAAAGLNLQFCAVGRESPTPQLVDLGREWDLSQIYHRVQVMMCALKLFPVLMHQMGQLPSTKGVSTRGLAQTVCRANGTAITYWDNYVEKSVDLSQQPEVNPTVMEAVYGAARGCPQLVQLLDGSHVAVEQGRYRVYLVPFGTELSTMQPPQGVALRHAIRCVLMALQWLHKRDWGHADVRWENIIQETEQTYRLIDLECAMRLGTQCSTMQQKPRAWGEHNEALVDGYFTQQSDLYLVGRLMQQAAADGSGDQSLMTALLNKTISVDAALSHSWFRG